MEPYKFIILKQKTDIMPKFKKDKKKNNGATFASLPVEFIMKIGEELTNTPHQFITFFSSNRQLTSINNSLHFHPTLKKAIQQERIDVSSELEALDESKNPQRYGDLFHQFNQNSQPNFAVISQKLSSLYKYTTVGMAITIILMLGLLSYSINSRINHSSIRRGFEDFGHCLYGLSIILLAILGLICIGKITVGTISSSMSFINNHRDTLIRKPIGFFSHYQEQREYHLERLHRLDTKEDGINKSADLKLKERIVSATI